MFVMYYVNGASRLSLLIASTNSIVFFLKTIFSSDGFSLK